MDDGQAEVNGSLSDLVIEGFWELELNTQHYTRDKHQSNGAGDGGGDRL